MERDSVTSGQHAESRVGGFHHDREGLAEVRGKLRAAGDELRAAGEQTPASPDAGQSSELLSNAMADLFLGSLGLGKEIEDLLGRVDAAGGSYGEVDNDSAGQSKVRESDAKEKMSGEQPWNPSSR